MAQDEHLSPASGSRSAAASVEAEAAAWAARLDAAGDGGKGALRGDLEAWLGNNPRHVGALLRAQAVLELAQAPADAPAAPVPEAKPHLSRSRWAWGAGGLIAASLALWLAVAGQGTRYATDRGELRQIALADGSALTLGAGSQLRVDMDDTARSLSLSEGRALFRVAHDRARPFRVRVGDVTITDIGTVFSLNKAEDAITLIVSEGEVEVSTGSARIPVHAGQSLRIPPGAAPALATMAPAAIERALAWSSGRIDLDGETLASAVAQFNQANRTTIRIADPALGRERLYGAFRLDDPASFARAAAISVNAPLAAHDGEWVIGAK